MSMNGNQVLTLCLVLVVGACVVGTGILRHEHSEGSVDKEQAIISLRSVDDQRDEAIKTIDVMVERDLPGYVIRHAYRLIGLGDDCRTRAREYLANGEGKFVVWPIVCATDRYKEVDVIYYQALFDRAAERNKERP